VPITGSFYYSEIQLRCYYTHLTCPNFEVLGIQRWQELRGVIKDEYQNIEVFYILRENLLDKFA